MTSTPTLLTSDILFGECPRWHEDRLWFSDVFLRQIIAVDLDGNRETMAELPAGSLGMDWLPDGRQLIAVSEGGRLLARQPDGRLDTHADLSHLATGNWNDLVVDDRGNAYVGNLGFDYGSEPFAPGTIALVTPDGDARQVADNVAFPNGMVVTGDGQTLVVAESYAGILTAHDITPDAELTARRVWATLPEGSVADGLSLDAEGTIWYADPPGHRCVRIREGGEVLQTVELDRPCIACALGGPDGTTLFMMASEFPDADTATKPPSGQILAIAAPAPKAGRP